MNFDQLPLIPDVNIFRAAMVSPETGSREVRKLVANGVIKPFRTPAGRTLLTTADGRRLCRSVRRKGPAEPWTNACTPAKMLSRSVATRSRTRCEAWIKPY